MAAVAARLNLVICPPEIEPGSPEDKEEEEETTEVETGGRGAGAGVEKGSCCEYCFS